MKKNNYTSFKNFLLYPWSIICFLIFHVALALSWLYFANFWDLGFNSLWGMFAFLPWFLAIFIPCLLFGTWNNENSKLNTLTLIPSAFVFLSCLFASSFPIWIVINYTGTADNLLIFVSYLATLFLCAIFISLASCCYLLFKNQILNLLTAVILGIAFAYISAPFFMPIIQGLLLPSSLFFFPATLIFLLFSSYLLNNNLLSFARKIIECSAAACILISMTVIFKPLDDSIFFDLTKLRVYSLSESSKTALKTLNSPVTIIFKKSPEFQEYNNALKKLLQRYVNESENKITLNEYPISNNEKSSLVIFDDTDKYKEIEILEGYGSIALENAITSAILELSQKSKKKIALISSLPIDGDPELNIPRWEIMKQIRERFDVSIIADDTQKIPDNIDVLLMVNPKNLSENIKKEIDNFTLNQGKLLLFLDPIPESEKAYPEAIKIGNINLNDWLDNLGVVFYNDKIVANPKNARKVLKDGNLIDYIIRLCITKLDFNNNDALMQNIEQLNITSAGYFDIIPKDNLVVTPLFSSGSDSGFFSLETVLENNNPITLKQKYIPDDKDYILALRVTGSPLSTYNKLLKSSNPVDILIFADTDILYDQFWILPNNGAFADNGDMILNALETLSDAPSLADLRAKQKQPLDVILIKKTNEKTILSIIALVPSPALLLILWIIYLWKRKLKNDKK